MKINEEQQVKKDFITPPDFKGDGKSHPVTDFKEIGDLEEIVYNQGAFNAATEARVCTLEMVFSHFNHELIWADFYGKQYFAWSALFSRFKNDIRMQLEAKILGYRGHGEDMGVLIGKKKGKSVMIIGSGPSLNKVLPRLKEWKGDIMCNSSQAPTIRYHGAHPTYIDIVDPRVLFSELNAPFDYKKTSLIVNPGLHPRCFDRWAGKRYYYRIFEPTYDFYSKVIKRTYGAMIPTYSYPFGSSLSCMLGHAKIMGYDTIFMVGCDLGFPNNEGRFAGWTRKRRVSWVSQKEVRDARTGQIVRPEKRSGIGWKWVCNPTTAPVFSDVPDDVPFLAENGVVTAPIHAIYRTQLMRVVAVDAPPVVNASEGIILDRHMAKVDPLYPIEHQDDENAFVGLPFHWGKQRLVAEQFLAKHNLFLIPIYDPETVTFGHRFIGMTDWRKELSGMIGILKQQGTPAEYELIKAHLEDVENGKISDDNEWAPAGISGEQPDNDTPQRSEEKA